MQNETIFLGRKVIFALHNWLKHNAADKLTFITDGMANIQVLEEEENISGSWLLQVLDTAERMVNFALICSINHRKLHVLNLIGMQNTSDLLVSWERKVF